MKPKKNKLAELATTITVNPALTTNYDEQPCIQRKVARAKEIIAKTGNPLAVKKAG